MLVNFMRFRASDGVELQGWLSEAKSDTAVLHIHGMSGNGYENRFLDHLREFYTKSDVSFFAIDTRGYGVINTFRYGERYKLGGSCFEIFAESVHDINGALDSIDKWLSLVNSIKHHNTTINVIKNAPHSFIRHEEEVTEVVKSFLQE